MHLHNIRLTKRILIAKLSFEPCYNNKISPLLFRVQKRSFSSINLNRSSPTKVMERSDIIEDSTSVSNKPLDSAVKTVISESTEPEDGTQYRLRIKNIPKYATPKMMKELLAKNGCEQVKIQKAPKWNYCFATLKTEEQQLYVLNKLKGIKFKNRELSIQVENVTEKDRQALFDRRKNEKQQNIEQSGVQKSSEEMLADQVTPLHIYEYQAQLEIKQNGIIKSLETFRDKMGELYNKSQYRSSQLQEKFDFKPPLDLKPMIHSPVLEGYRNKCEFTAGLNLKGEKTVGFLLGAYKDGLDTVLEPDNSIHVSDVAKKIAKAMQNYIRQSLYDVYNRKTKQGNWRQVTVRSQKSGDIMIIIQIHPQGLSKEQIDQEKSALAEYFKMFAKEENFHLTSLLMQLYSGVSNGMSEDPLDCIFGTPFIHEEMMNCRFRISPRAFFQTNTAAAELLYQQCGDIIKEIYRSKDFSESPTLLDMCCGTGTIGIALSKSLGTTIKGVVGIELCKEAIEDAKINASLNEINNVEYILGPVEKNLFALRNFNNEASGTAVAIVDPPRAGVHKNVIKALRTCRAIEHFIYISCDHNAAIQNFVDICRPDFPGVPFKPVKAIGVDLFPHAKHVELIIEFRRNREDSEIKIKSDQLTYVPSTSQLRDVSSTSVSQDTNTKE